jgi:uncharacterized protein YjbI with pentapeptide repeats
MKYRLAVLVVLLASTTSPLRADILRWDNGQIIPGTEGLTPGPGVDLGLRQLEFAELSGIDLTDASLRGAMLTDAKFVGAKLIRANFSPSKLGNANFSQADLTSAYFAYADVTGADFSDAIVNNAVFECFSGCLTQAQLQSTASYQAKDLRGIDLSSINLQDWDFHDQDLSRAVLRSGVANVNLAGANLTDAYIERSLANADLTGAIVNGTWFTNMNHSAYYDQFRSTASYQNKDLRRIGLPDAFLRNWDFHGQNLDGANLNSAVLEFADLSEATLAHASLQRTTRPGGFTLAQLQSTASYLNKSLPGVDLSYNDLTDWDFAGQDLTDADFSNAVLKGADLSDASLPFANLSSSDFTNANFSDANLHFAYLGDSRFTNTNFAGAIINSASFRRATTRGFTREQLESTASYQARTMAGVQLDSNNMSSWNFQDQDLSFGVFTFSVLHDTSFSSANLQNANLLNAYFSKTNLRGADLRGARYEPGPEVVTDNAIRPDGTVAGLDLANGDRMIIRDDDGVPPNQPVFGPEVREPLRVTIQEQLTMADGGALQLRFDADDWDSLITFDPGIPVQLGGALELAFEGDVHLASQVGRTFRVFDWTGVTPEGQLEVVSDYAWDTSRLYTTGDVTLTAVPEPGTFVLAALLITTGYFTKRRI